MIGADEAGPGRIAKSGNAVSSVEAHERLARAEDLVYSRPAEAEELAREVLSTSSGTSLRGKAMLLVGRAEYRLGATARATQSLGEAQEALSEAGDRQGTVNALLAQVRAKRDLGRHADATRDCNEALALARSLKDPEAEADALYLRGSVCDFAGNYPAALDSLEAALAIASEHELAERQGNILNNLGTLHTDLGDHAPALENLTAAHGILRMVAPGTRSELANLTSLGVLYLSMGDVEAATDYFEQARIGARGADDLMVEAAATNNLANARCGASDWQGARSLYADALRIAQKLGVRQYEIDNLDGLGQVHSALGEHERALEAHAEALEVARSIGDREGEVDGLLNVGHEQLELGQVDEALGSLRQGLSLAVELERKHSIYRAHELLTSAHERSDDPVRALYHHREFYRAEKTVFNEETERRTRRLSAKFELERARHEAEQYRLSVEVTEKAREEAEAEVRERTRELEEAQIEVVTRLAVAAEYRDDETGEHTRRVGRNAALIARALGWSDEEVGLMFTAARLHDVGKIGVSDKVLLKPATLDVEEFEQVRAHTTIGASILSGGQSRLLALAEEIALAHHERWDGKGYPFGLAREVIPMSARIVSVADVLDALTHSRPYKRAWSVDEALAEVSRQAGRQFDPGVVRACLEVFGPDSDTSPLDSGEEWSPPPVPRVDGRWARQSGSGNVDGIKDRFDKLLAHRTRELEAVRAETKSAVRQMEELAFTDELTGLGNRRAFDANLELEVSRALRSGDEVTVLRIDPHIRESVRERGLLGRGDELLGSFGKSVQKQLRSYGRVYRVGGDEFIAVLVHLSSAEFPAVLELVKEAAEAMREGGERPIALRTGIAALPAEAHSAAELLAISGERLYRSEPQRGRVDTSVGGTG